MNPDELLKLIQESKISTPLSRRVEKIKDEEKEPAGPTISARTQPIEEVPDFILKAFDVLAKNKGKVNVVEPSPQVQQAEKTVRTEELKRTGEKLSAPELIAMFNELINVAALPAGAMALAKKNKALKNLIEVSEPKRKSFPAVSARQLAREQLSREKLTKGMETELSAFKQESSDITKESEPFKQDWKEDLDERWIPDYERRIGELKQEAADYQKNKPRNLSPRIEADVLKKETKREQQLLEEDIMDKLKKGLIKPEEANKAIKQLKESAPPPQETPDFKLPPELKATAPNYFRAGRIVPDTQQSMLVSKPLEEAYDAYETKMLNESPSPEWKQSRAAVNRAINDISDIIINNNPVKGEYPLPYEVRPVDILASQYNLNTKLSDYDKAFILSNMMNEGRDPTQHIKPNDLLQNHQIVISESRQGMEDAVASFSRLRGLSLYPQNIQKYVQSFKAFNPAETRDFVKSQVLTSIGHELRHAGVFADVGDIMTHPVTGKYPPSVLANNPKLYNYFKNVGADPDYHLAKTETNPQIHGIVRSALSRAGHKVLDLKQLEDSVKRLSKDPILMKEVNDQLYHSIFGATPKGFKTHQNILNHFYNFTKELIKEYIKNPDALKELGRYVKTDTKKGNV